MDIQEAQKLKRATEEQILALISAFETTSNTVVDAIYLDHIHSMGYRENTVTVRLSVSL